MAATMRPLNDVVQVKSVWHMVRTDYHTNATQRAYHSVSLDDRAPDTDGNAWATRSGYAVTANASDYSPVSSLLDDTSPLLLAARR